MIRTVLSSTQQYSNIRISEKQEIRFGYTTQNICQHKLYIENAIKKRIAPLEFRKKMSQQIKLKVQQEAKEMNLTLLELKRFRKVIKDIWNRFNPENHKGILIEVGEHKLRNHITCKDMIVPDTTVSIARYVNTSGPRGTMNVFGPHSSDHPLINQGISLEVGNTPHERSVIKHCKDRFMRLYRVLKDITSAPKETIKVKIIEPNYGF